MATLRDAEGGLLGGLYCGIYLGALHIEWAWIEESHRRRGHGRTMVLAAEAEGVRRGAGMAHLDTFSFQARGFYERLGYAVFGTLDFPAPGLHRFYMTKALPGG